MSFDVVATGGIGLTLLLAASRDRDGVGAIRKAEEKRLREAAVRD
jgi:hypothetical protein